MAHRPGIDASRIKRITAAAARHEAMWPTVRDHIMDWRERNGVNTGLPPIPAIALNLEAMGFTAPRGGAVSYRTVQALLARYEQEIERLQFRVQIARKLPSGGTEIMMLSHVKLRDNQPPWPRGSIGMVVEITSRGTIVVHMGDAMTGEMIAVYPGDVESVGY